MNIFYMGRESACNFVGHFHCLLPYLLFRCIHVCVAWYHVHDNYGACIEYSHLFFHSCRNRWPVLNQGRTSSSFSCCRTIVSASGDPQRFI